MRWLDIFRLWLATMLTYIISKIKSWLSLDGLHHEDGMIWKRFPHYWPFARQIWRIPFTKVQQCGLFILDILLTKQSCCRWFEMHRRTYDVTGMPREGLTSPATVSRTECSLPVAIWIGALSSAVQKEMGRNEMETIVALLGLSTEIPLVHWSPMVSLTKGSSAELWCFVCC